MKSSSGENSLAVHTISSSDEHPSTASNGSSEDGIDVIAKNEDSDKLDVGD